MTADWARIARSSWGRISTTSSSVPGARPAYRGGADPAEYLDQHTDHRSKSRSMIGSSMVRLLRRPKAWGRQAAARAHAPDPTPLGGPFRPRSRRGGAAASATPIRSFPRACRSAAPSRGACGRGRRRPRALADHPGGAGDGRGDGVSDDPTAASSTSLTLKPRPIPRLQARAVADPRCAPVRLSFGSVASRARRWARARSSTWM